MIYIMDKIVACYYNDIPKYGFEPNDVRPLAERLTLESRLWLRHHVYQLHFCDLQIRAIQRPVTEFETLERFTFPNWNEYL